LPTVAEDPLAQAERHVLEGEERVAKQIELVARMKADGDSERLIVAGETLLATLQRTVELAREHLAIERQARGILPD
jgi:hypothetical protein